MPFKTFLLEGANCLALVAAFLRSTHPNNFTLHTVFPWILSNTPALTKLCHTPKSWLLTVGNTDEILMVYWKKNTPQSWILTAAVCCCSSWLLLMLVVKKSLVVLVSSRATCCSPNLFYLFLNISNHICMELFGISIEYIIVMKQCAYGKHEHFFWRFYSELLISLHAFICFQYFLV